MSDLIFGISKSEIERQCRMNPVRYCQDEPINCGEFLEPCIRGGQQILEDPKLCSMLNRIYRKVPQKGW